MNTYTEQVKRGAALLDAKSPGWRESIDLSMLDLSHGCLCILGQIFDYYDNGVFALLGIGRRGYSYGDWMHSSDFQIVGAHGFTLDSDEDAEWDALREAWIAELGAHRGD